MTKDKTGVQGAHEVKKKRANLPPEEAHKRKQRVLTQGTPSITTSIADAVVIKDEDVFFLSTPNGDVPSGGNHGFGLYYHDCRYLNGYVFRLANSELNILVSNARAGYRSIFELTNPELEINEGVHIQRDWIGVTWERAIISEKPGLEERFTFQNYSLQPVEFEISLTFQAEFEDVFTIRGLLPEKPGHLYPPEWKDGSLSFAYDGADQIRRELNIKFSVHPDSQDKSTAIFLISLEPRGKKQIQVALLISEIAEKASLSQKDGHRVDFRKLAGKFQRPQENWPGECMHIQSDSMLLNRIIERSIGDLAMLRADIDGQHFFAAGVPWFATLFGRDSLIACLQTLAFDHQMAAETLRLLARFQGKEVDHWRDEQPGKILHELRVGELAHLGEIPHTPYYGTIDATPLFLILLCKYTDWTGDLSLFDELRPSVEKAIQWIAIYGDTTGNGYVDYESKSQKGLVNQGWKDSGDAIINSDGSLADPPIALVEVQGYVYLAKKLLSGLYLHAGDRSNGEKFSREADELRQRFNRDFWMEDQDFFALALQKDDRPVEVISSNPGQALWTGIVEPDKALRVAQRLLSEELYNGWGVRTLSEKEKRFNPIGYHLGTVWPHDNSIIMAGLRRYHFDQEALKLFTGITEAATFFTGYRLPELFAGFKRQEYHIPVHYPVACHPQAWAAGSVPYMLVKLLGIEPDALNQQLKVVRPQLPEYTNKIEIKGLRVGNASVDLNFARNSSGDAMVHVAKVEGKLDVIAGGQDCGV